MLIKGWNCLLITIVVSGALVLPANPCMTQELELEIVSISDEALPTITVRFLLTRGGERVNSQESVQYELIEDGTQLNTTVLCEGDYNSVAFVIGDFPYLLLDTNAVSYMKDGF